MDKNEEKQLAQFISAYKELKASKIVLAEKNISNILKCVAENDFIYNLIAEKIVGYDFAGTMTKLLNGDVDLEEITKTDAVIPFVFCVLNEIDNRHIETVAFVQRIFKDDSEEGFKDFCKDLVAPFVYRIKDYMVGEDEDFDEENVFDPADVMGSVFTKELIERVKFVVGEISARVHECKKVPEELLKDIDIVCYSIDLCINAGEFLGMFGLLSGLKQCIYPLKKFKAEINEIEFILDTMNKE